MSRRPGVSKRRALVLAASIAVLATPALFGLLGPGEAAAERRGRRPIQREDVDAAREHYSKLWDRTVMPHQKRYMALIDPARRIVAGGRSTATTESEADTRRIVRSTSEASTTTPLMTPSPFQA